MAFSRYTRDFVSPDGKGLGTPGAAAAVRLGIKIGDIPITQTLVTTQADRLDTLAGALYGDGRYWWVLAAASNIGWGLQVPPGTLINVPDLRAVERIAG
jgi:nucleoid-associated protein YgaU